MGLDRVKKTPCGFCFVEYYQLQDAQDCVSFISGLRVDERVIRVDKDAGFVEGRQYGRGRSGGQVRDEYRSEPDSGRGGLVDAARAKDLPRRQGFRPMPRYAQNDSPIAKSGAQKRGREESDEDGEEEEEEEGSYKRPKESKNPRFRENQGSDEEA
eukprot:Sdes_comp19651_c0_seq1m11454